MCLMLFSEILRSIDALQLTFKFNNDIFTPCGWKVCAYNNYYIQYYKKNNILN